jgi:DNA-directed RNA polymerase specialized sigma24 family protein
VLRKARHGGGNSLLPEDKSPEKISADVELSTIIRGYIAELDDEERVFFNHRFASALTQEATAEAMNCTRARVKLLEKRLRESFLVAMRDRGYFVDHDMKPRWSRKAA